MYHEPDRSNRTIRGVFYLLGKTACENQQFQHKGFVAIHNQTVSEMCMLYFRDDCS